MQSLNSSNIVDFIGDIFARRGADSYLGEEVTMSEHMLQAALLAEEETGDDLLIAAALLHDIGHYTNEFPENALAEGINNHHDAAGAAVIAPYFPSLVVDCVQYHVDAKRYLCAVENDYFAQLSPASVHTLTLQGGPMAAAEVAEFASLEYLSAIVRVRRWDEGAKVAGKQTPGFDYYADFLRRVLLEEQALEH
ncbi:MAG: HD domain-containing protein [Pseudomonadota bacterium]